MNIENRKIVRERSKRETTERASKRDGRNARTGGLAWKKGVEEQGNRSSGKHVQRLSACRSRYIEEKRTQRKMASGNSELHEALECVSE